MASRYVTKAESRARAQFTDRAARIGGHADPGLQALEWKKFQHEVESFRHAHDRGAERRGALSFAGWTLAGVAAFVTAALVVPPLARAGRLVFGTVKHAARGRGESVKDALRRESAALHTFLDEQAREAEERLRGLPEYADLRQRFAGTASPGRVLASSSQNSASSPSPVGRGPG